MTISLEQLLHYVDGECSEAQRQHIEAAAARDPEVQQQLLALQASKLPYEAAFQSQPMPAMPQALKDDIATLIKVSDAAHLPTTDDNVAHWMTSKPASLIAVAASVMLAFVGGFSTHALLPQTDSAAPYQSAAQVSPTQTNTHQAGSDNPPTLRAAGDNNLAVNDPWAKVVADYHSLYVTETVANSQNGLEKARTLLTRLAQEHNLEHGIPDLSTQGWSFVRAQQLGFEGKPLVQLVYLNAQGEPLALCFMRDNQASEAPYSAQFGEMNAVLWRDNGFRYIAVSHPVQSDIEAIPQLSQEYFL